MGKNGWSGESGTTGPYGNQSIHQIRRRNTMTGPISRRGTVAERQNRCHSALQHLAFPVGPATWGISVKNFLTTFQR